MAAGKAIVGGIVGLMALGGIIGGATNGSSNGSEAPAVTTPDTISQSDANLAVNIQAKVCDLIAQGYSTGEIIDGLAANGESSGSISAVVTAAAANC